MGALKPATGLGSNLTADFHRVFAQDGGKFFDFLEIDPGAHELTPEAEEMFAGLGAEYPVVLHSTALSICGDNSLDPLLLSKVAAFASITDCDVYSDHISFTWAGDVNLDMYMPPIFTDEMLDRLAVRSHLVKKRVQRDFALENVGMLFAPPGSEYTEVDFLTELVSRTDVPLQLNLDSIIISASTLGRDPQEYLLGFPLASTVTIAVVPVASMNPLLRQRYGNGIETLMLRLLDVALRNSDANRVVVQRNPGDCLKAFHKFFDAVRAVYQTHRR